MCEANNGILKSGLNVEVHNHNFYFAYYSIVCMSFITKCDHLRSF